MFCMVLGSSSVPELLGPGRKLRWAALVVLAAIALLLGVRDRRAPGRNLLWVTALGCWLAVLGAVSTAWSVDPRLSFGRAGSFGILVLAAFGLALAARTRPALPSRLLAGILGGTVAAALGGIVLLAFRYDQAVQVASTVYPARYQGLGQNPDTASMLEGFSLPIALWALTRSRSRRTQALAVVAAFLLLGSIAASGSRGGMIAALVGGLVYSLVLAVPFRRRLALALAVVLAVGAGTGVSQIPQPLKTESQQPSSHTGGSKAPPPVPVGAPVGPSEHQYGGPLGDELFRFNAGTRSLLTSSGRLEAWWEAVKQGANRPVLGYGFGTEEKVFVDRVYNFEGGHVENSFVGMFLQLGAVGEASFVALVLALCTGVVLALRGAPRDRRAEPLAALVAGGIVLMAIQSYAYSVGNVVTVAFWTAGFTVAALASTAVRPHPVAVPAGFEERAVVPR